MWAALGLLFVLSVLVQLLVWQNNTGDIDAAMSGLTANYASDADVLLSGDIGKFLSGQNPPNDAAIMAHPPGYAIFSATVLAVFGKGNALRAAHGAVTALCPILAFLVALQLFGRQTAGVAGVLTGVSPQLSYNALLLLPDAIAVVPVVAAFLVLVTTKGEKYLLRAALCGLLLGVACWLRANFLFLPVFFCAAAFFALPVGVRWRFILNLTIAFIIVLAPITLRNVIVFGSLTPLSIGSGVTLVEGIGEYDRENRFGLPATDDAVLKTEAEHFGRPDYLGSLYSPDGLERERYRIGQGLDVIAAEPAWFAGVMVRRAVSMFRLERVPAISADKPDTDRPGGLAHYLNAPLRMFQKLYITAVVLPLFLIGLMLLLRKKEERIKLAVLLIVPLYFVCFQSVLHTEYRYLLAIQPFMLTLAAVAMTALAGRLFQLLNVRRLTRS